MRQKILAQYIKDVNTFDSTPQSKVRRLTRSMFKSLDFWLLVLMGIALSIYLFLNGMDNFVYKIR